MFYDQQILCPKCPQKQKIINLGKDAKIITLGSDLDLVEENYSGCGVDHARCPQCNKLFQILYKVDKIEEINDNQ